MKSFKRSICILLVVAMAVVPVSIVAAVYMAEGGYGITGTDATKTDVTGTDITGTDVTRTDVTETDVTRTDVTGTDVTDIHTDPPVSTTEFVPPTTITTNTTRNITNPYGEGTVATISIFGHFKKGISSGHTWIYVENVSNEDIMVALQVLHPGEGVSFGTFFFSRSDGGGLYYNIETYCLNEYGADNRYSLTEGLTYDELATLNNKLSYSNYWGMFYNCTMFTIDVWNTVADSKIIPIPIPLFTYLIIRLKGGEKDKPMYFTGRDTVSKQIGNGPEAYLITVSDKSLRNAI